MAVKPAVIINNALRAVAALANHGPSGAVRSPELLLQRLQQELKEARQAREPLEKAEEAADVMYYALLLAFNAPRLAGLSLDAIVRAMLAKYVVRFIMNKRTKNRAAEYRAIQQAIKRLPEQVEKALRHL